MMLTEKNEMETSVNEFELLEFKIGKNCYGINVAKIKEILPYREVTPIPNAHPFIEGIFMPRNVIITSIDLAKALRLKQYDYGKRDMAIITRFNQVTVSLHVEEVVGIHRVQWEDISRPDSTIDDNSLATGIVKINNKLVILLDLEKIMSEINSELAVKKDKVEKYKSYKENFQKLLVVEDSSLIGREIKECLMIAGYKNVEVVSNGKMAWDILKNNKEKENINEFDCVITDIEMPVMDGRQLIKLMKADSDYESLPVVIFSSIVENNDETDEALIQADAKEGKPDIEKLIKVINNLFGN